jgi:hypothetical protein
MVCKPLSGKRRRLPAKRAGGNTVNPHSKLREGVIMSSAVDREKIAQRAYQIYEQRGKRPGSELDDWIKAEQELMDQGKPKSQSSKKKSFPY